MLINGISSLILALICGALASRITGRHNGCLMNVIVGFIGAYLGRFCAEHFGALLLPIFSPAVNGILWNIVGAVLFCVILNLILGPKKK